MRREPGFLFLVMNRVAILGPGLLGGSLALALRERTGAEIAVWGRRAEAVAEVAKSGFADFASVDVRAVVEGADMVVLCTPVGVMPALAGEIAPALAPTALVTDVGSVKAAVLSGAGAVFKQAGVNFIGSHPMAGAEVSGLEAARTGLFQGAACILTPEPDTTAAALEKVDAFWKAIGCRTARMDATRHDEVVARISHLPHLAAVAATLAAFQPDPGMAEFAAGGLRDTTRVAAGLPVMWREILLENRAAILPALADLHRFTGELLEILNKADEVKLLTVLEHAKQLRATRY